MQRRVLTLRFRSRKLDVGLIGIESNILSHESSVHDSRVNRNTLSSVETAWLQDWLRSSFPVFFPLTIPCPPSTSDSRNRPGSFPTTLPLKFSGSRRCHCVTSRD